MQYITRGKVQLIIDSVKPQIRVAPIPDYHLKHAGQDSTIFVSNDSNPDRSLVEYASEPQHRSHP
jgi:hypothetical protein